MIRSIAILAVCMWCAGCVSTTKLTPEVASDLKQTKVAAAFYVEGKKILYDEMVYKVLWNENRSQNSIFEGSWDVDKDVSSTFSKSLSDVGITAQPISQVLNDKSLYQQFEQSVVNTRGADGMNTPMQMPQALREAFLQRGVEYVVLLRAAHYQVKKVSGFAPQFSLPSMLYVYDIRRDTQHFDEMFHLGGKIVVDKSPREVEANDMAKLRTATHEWVATATKTRLPSALGLQP